MGVLFLVLILILGMAYLDAKKMQGLLEEGDKTVVYQEGNELLAGIQVGEGGFLIEGEGRLPENINVFNKTTLQEYETLFAEDKDVGENELIFIITNNTFANLTNMSLNDINISKETFDIIMNSATPKEATIEAAIAAANVTPAEKAFVEEAVAEEIDHFSDEELKSALFLVAFSQYIEEEGEQAILEQVKEGNIDIKPDFWIMKLIKFMPDKVFERVMQQAVTISGNEEAAN